MISAAGSLKVPPRAEAFPAVLASSSRNARMAALTPDLHQTELAIVEMTNAARARQKLAPVRINPTLTGAARAYGQYMARTKTFSHTADGRSAADRATAAGYAYCMISENLSSNLDSRGFATRDLARQAVEGWLNSPGHRQNMLAPYATETGVAVVQVPDRNPKFVTVQLFGRPQSLSYEFQISNDSKTTVSYTFGGETTEIGPHSSTIHTSCEPSAVVFTPPRPAQFAPGVKGRYEARDGQLYTLTSDDKSRLQITVGKRESLR
jgi:uncharacterized protein YkwD